MNVRCDTLLSAVRSPTFSCRWSRMCWQCRESLTRALSPKTKIHMKLVLFKWRKVHSLGSLSFYRRPCYSDTCRVTAEFTVPYENIVKVFRSASFMSTLSVNNCYEEGVCEPLTLIQTKMLVDFGGNDGQTVSYQTLWELLSHRYGPKLLCKYDNLVTKNLYSIDELQYVLRNRRLSDTFCCFNCCEQQL